MSHEPGNDWEPPDLSGKIVIVTGASRGVGRGIAAAFGDTGSTVYVTGRSVEGEATTEGLPGTIEETARLVTERGGLGIAVRCDHTDDHDIEWLMSAIDEAGPPDVLVNNAWPGYERSDEGRFDHPFWKQPRWRYDLFFDALRGMYVTTQLVAQRMVGRVGGLIVLVSFTDGDIYLGQVPYDVVKHAANRMAFGMAEDLRRYDVSVMALHPGFVRTERVEAAWRRLGDGPAAVVHSPEYVGRAAAVLAASEDVMTHTGEAVAVGDIARRYGFRDVDGRQPPPFRLEGSISLARRMQRLHRVVAKAESR